MSISIEAKMAPFKIVVGTCKAYGSVARLWHRAAARYWPEAAAHAVICTDHDPLVPEFTGDRVFAHGAGWCDGLIACLQACDEEFIAFVLDDYILESPVPHAALVDLARRMRDEGDIGAIYLIDAGLAGTGPDRNGVFDIARGPYSINSCPGLWRRTFLIETLRSFKDPWAWEAFAFGTPVARRYRTMCWGGDALYTYSFRTGGLIYRGAVSRAGLARIAPPEVLGASLSDLPEFTFEQAGAVAKRSLSWKLRFLQAGFGVSPMTAWIFIRMAVKARLGLRERAAG